MLANDAAAEQLDVAPRSRDLWPDALPKDDASTEQDEESGLICVGASVSEEESVIGPGGERTLLTSRKPVRILDETLLLSTSLDITERKARREGAGAARLFRRADRAPQPQPDPAARRGTRFGARGRASASRSPSSTSTISSTSTTTTATRSATRCWSRSRERIASRLRDDRHARAHQRRRVPAAARPGRERTRRSARSVDASARRAQAAVPHRGLRDLHLGLDRREHLSGARPTLRGAAPQRRQRDVSRQERAPRAAPSIFDLKHRARRSRRAWSWSSGCGSPSATASSAARSSPRSISAPRRWSGFETLVRWRDEDGEIQPPSAFVGLADRARADRPDHPFRARARR